jgi:hypothetical protein
MVVGEGVAMGLAASIDKGRGRTLFVTLGMESVRAIAASEGKPDEAEVDGCGVGEPDLEEGLSR